MKSEQCKIFCAINFIILVNLLKESTKIIISNIDSSLLMCLYDELLFRLKVKHFFYIVLHTCSYIVLLKFYTYFLFTFRFKKVFF